MNWCWQAKNWGRRCRKILVTKWYCWRNGQEEMTVLEFYRIKGIEGTQVEQWSSNLPIAESTESKIQDPRNRYLRKLNLMMKNILAVKFQIPRTFTKITTRALLATSLTYQERLHTSLETQWPNRGDLVWLFEEIDWNEFATRGFLDPNSKKGNFHLFCPISREYWPVSHWCFIGKLQSERFVHTDQSGGIFFSFAKAAFNYYLPLIRTIPFISKSIGRYSPTCRLHRIGMRSTAFWIRLLHQGRFQSYLSLHANWRWILSFGLDIDFLRNIIWQSIILQHSVQYCGEEHIHYPSEITMCHWYDSKVLRGACRNIKDTRCWTGYHPHRCWDRWHWSHEQVRNFL